MERRSLFEVLDNIQSSFQTFKTPLSAQLEKKFPIIKQSDVITNWCFSFPNIIDAPCCRFMPSIFKKWIQTFVAGAGERLKSFFSDWIFIISCSNLQSITILQTDNWDVKSKFWKKKVLNKKVRWVVVVVVGTGVEVELKLEWLLLLLLLWLLLFLLLQ